MSLRHPLFHRTIKALFIDAQECKEFCAEYNYKMCLDISHSQMACTYKKTSLLDFIKIIGSEVVHLHIADALGVDGEGVKIGEGDVNFSETLKYLDIHCPNIPFIPEIWQGHKNMGEGFWSALNFIKENS